MSSAIAISCQGVSKRFALIDRGNAWRVVLGLDGSLKKFQALRNVSFDVPKGQFVGVLGRNGAGKSTLLRVIGGVFKPDTGKVRVNGLLSGIFELGLVGNVLLTGRQYAERLLRLHGISHSERAIRIADIHDFSELGERFDDPVQTYSSGMRARLFFATATAGHYEVYLLDEVLSVGDQHFQSKCWRRMRDRLSAGASGILVTHDWSAILRLCETAHVLDRGEIRYSGPAEKAVRHYLYGDELGESYEAGVARFVEKPTIPAQIESATDLHIRAEAEILRHTDVFSVLVIERLQRGFGWETSLMSRHPTLLGSEPGFYAIDISIPHLPLEAGHYQANLHLFRVDEAEKRVVLDGFGWLNGNGLGFEVIGSPKDALSLPVRWEMRS